MDFRSVEKTSLGDWIHGLERVNWGLDGWIVLESCLRRGATGRGREGFRAAWVACWCDGLVEA